jgi:hypothetical protein
MKAYVYLSTVLGIAFFGALGVAADLPQRWETNRIADSLFVEQGVLFNRVEAKQQILDDVIAGRMTLPKAAEKFGELNSQAPESMTAVRDYFAGDTDNERLCRQVIHRVKFMLDEDSSEAATVIARLEREMHEYLGGSSSESE